MRLISSNSPNQLVNLFKKKFMNVGSMNFNDYLSKKKKIND